MGGGKGGSPPPPPTPPPPPAEDNPFEEGSADASAKTGKRRKGSARSLVIPKPSQGAGPYSGGG